MAKPTIASYREKDEPFHLDEATVYKLLKISAGDRDKAAEALRRAKLGVSREELDKIIEGSSILKAYFGTNSHIIHAQGTDPESALLRLPDVHGEEVAEVDLSRVVRLQDEYIAARGLEGVGFSSEDIEEMESMAQFVGHGFRKTIDITHGVMVVQMWNLKKRADEIREILNNDEEKERVIVTEKGDVVRYVTERFTDSEKLEWQKELTNIVDQIRRIADSSNQAAAIRMKAEMNARAIEEKESKPTKKGRQRLKKVS